MLVTVENADGSTTKLENTIDQEGANDLFQWFFQVHQSIAQASKLTSR